MRIKTFDMKIKQLRNKNKLNIIIMSVIVAILLVLSIKEVLPKKIVFTQFNKNKKTSLYVTEKVKYLIGPILRTQNSKEEIFDYYIALNQEDEMFVLKTQDNNYNIPILGVDIEEKDIDSLQGIEIQGNVGDIASGLNTLLKQKIEKILGMEFSDSKVFTGMVGYYYFDANFKILNMSKNFLMIAGIFGVLDFLYILVERKNNKKINTALEKILNEGKLEEVKKEYEGGKLIEYKMLSVSILPNYIMSYINGLLIIPFKDIKDIYATKKINGAKSRYKFIVVETKDGLVYYITALRKRKEKKIFDELLNAIKSRQNKGVEI